MSQSRGEGPAEAVFRLRTEMVALASQLTSVPDAVPRTYAGADRTGSVQVVLDEAGRPTDVAVAANWRDSVGLSGLTDAVRQAWQSAVTARLTAWSAAPATPVPAGVPSSAAALPADAAPGDLLDHRVQSNLAGLLSLLADVESAIDRMERLGGDSAGARVRGRSSGGEVLVTISSGELIELRTEPDWLADTSTTAVGRAIREALVDACATVERSEPAGQPAALRELAELTADPLALLRTVGLLRD